MKTACEVLGVARSGVAVKQVRDADWQDGRRARKPSVADPAVQWLRQQFTDVAEALRRQCKQQYKRRNEVERLFRRLKGFLRILSRFEKLDVMFLAFIYFALIVDGIR